MALLGNIPGEEGQEKNATLWHFFMGGTIWRQGFNLLSTCVIKGLSVDKKCHFVTSWAIKYFYNTSIKVSRETAGCQRWMVGYVFGSNGKTNRNSHNLNPYKHRVLF